MSFSKARIQRFNEFENDVPPPGAYDPKFDNNVKSFIIEKSERFHDNKSVGRAEGNVTVCSKLVNVTASFRTPQLPRKQNPDQTRSSSRLKPRALIASNDQKLKYNTEHQLTDLQVECFNKDKTIQELKKHIEDMKEEVQKLESQLEELRKKTNRRGRATPEGHRNNGCNATRDLKRLRREASIGSKASSLSAFRSLGRKRTRNSS